MAWLQQNFVMILFLVVVVLFMLRGFLMAKYYGIEELGAHQLSVRLNGDSPPVLLDVRTPGEFNEGHVRQAVLVPLQELHLRAPNLLQEFKGREVAVICRTGNRSLFGAIALRRAGFEKVYNVTGGMVSWGTKGYPVKQ